MEQDQQGTDALWEPLEAAGWGGPRRVDALGVHDLWHVLQWTVQRHPASVADLLAAGAQPDDASRPGPPALIMACRQAPDAVAPLLAHGADVNLSDIGGYTPLMEAAFCHPRLVRGLLQAGARPNDVAQNGGNAFWAWLWMSPVRSRTDSRRWPKAPPADLEAGCLLIQAGAEWVSVFRTCANPFLVHHLVMNVTDVSPLVDSLKDPVTADTILVRRCVEVRLAHDRAARLRDVLPEPFGHDARRMRI